MAILIPMVLLENNSKVAIYQYSQPLLEQDPVRPRRMRVYAHQYGQALLDKETGEITQVEGSDWDSGFFFVRVRARMQRNHEAGRYPESDAYEA